jgi:hypothetical protein
MQFLVRIGTCWRMVSNVHEKAPGFGGMRYAPKENALEVQKETGHEEG